jgi:peptidoglycan/xylan/chitin deacetylase (PgdA/CDA1 family)
MAWELGGLGLCAGAGIVAYGVRGRSSQLLGPSVYRGPRDRRSVALTFDDGPSESTPLLLEVLAEHDVRATFFQCGFNVSRLPVTARAVAEAGHEIGNHSYSHAWLLFRSSGFMEQELLRAQESILHATGCLPSLFRAPYGARWFGLRRAQKKLGLLGVMWTTIARDWRLPAGKIASVLRRGMRNGAILCLHDGRGLKPQPNIGNTVEAVRRIIPEFLEQGFQFETVSQLVRSR